MTLRSRLLPKLGAIVVVAMVLVVGGALPASAAASITGGGSGFAAPEIDQWKADTAVNPFNLTINYVAQGSSFGRVSFTQNTLDFGASDIVYPDPEKAALQSGRCGGRPLAQCFVYVPISAGGLGLMYNLQDASGNRVRNLRLTRRAACKIFTGAITQWNDPELVATNPFLATFGRPIKPVIRADGAGESYVFAEFCIAVAPDVWHAFIQDRIAHDAANVADDFKAGEPVSNWPQNWGQSNPVPFADGVANAVASPDIGTDSITYDAAAYAVQRQFPMASLQNAVGVFTQPDETNVTVALAYAKGRGDGTFVLNFNGADPRAYFPSTYSYVLAQTTGFDPRRGATLAQFLCYAVSKGQTDAVPLKYARLSSQIVNIAIDAIVRIPGAPSKAACPVAGAPPPPPPIQVVPGSGNGGGGGTGPGNPNAPGGTGPGSAAQGAGNGLTGTTRPGATGNRVAGGGPGGLTAGGISSGPQQSTTTTIPAEVVDQKLADAALERNTGSKPLPAIWLLLAGVAAAWGVSFVLTRRRTA